MPGEHHTQHTMHQAVQFRALALTISPGFVFSLPPHSTVKLIIYGV